MLREWIKLVLSRETARISIPAIERLDLTRPAVDLSVSSFEGRPLAALRDDEKLDICRKALRKLEGHDPKVVDEAARALGHQALADTATEVLRGYFNKKGPREFDIYPPNLIQACREIGTRGSLDILVTIATDRHYHNYLWSGDAGDAICARFEENGKDWPSPLEERLSKRLCDAFGGYLDPEAKRAFALLLGHSEYPPAVEALRKLVADGLLEKLIPRAAVAAYASLNKLASSHNEEVRRLLQKSEVRGALERMSPALLGRGVEPHWRETTTPYEPRGGGPITGNNGGRAGGF